MRFAVSGQLVEMFGMVIPASAALAFFDLLVNTFLSIAFGEKSKLKLGGRW